jgi:VIT1/CCC1 family predicted Fe2+/Mn2+ transporter
VSYNATVEDHIRGALVRDPRVPSPDEVAMATRSSAPHIVPGAIGIAVAATIGMGAGQYLSDEQRNVRKAVAMALATLIGSVLPALPFVFGSSTACVVASLAITLLAATVIGHYRGYVVTYTILIVVAVLTVGLSIAVA